MGKRKASAVIEAWERCALGTKAAQKHVGDVITNFCGRRGCSVRPKVVVLQLHALRKQWWKLPCILTVFRLSTLAATWLNEQTVHSFRFRACSWVRTSLKLEMAASRSAFKSAVLCVRHSKAVSQVPRPRERSHLKTWGWRLVSADQPSWESRNEADYQSYLQRVLASTPPQQVAQELDSLHWIRKRIRVASTSMCCTSRSRLYVINDVLVPLRS